MSFDYSQSSPPHFPSVQEREGSEHRKRRRNRLRASCLNCYASKRKCDKRRPCTRCVRLGTTSLCVYEIEDPALIEQDHLDEIRALKQQVACLESVILDLRSRVPRHNFVHEGIITVPSPPSSSYSNYYEEAPKPHFSESRIIHSPGFSAREAASAHGFSVPHGHPQSHRSMVDNTGITQQFACSNNDKTSPTAYASPPLSYFSEEDRGSPVSAHSSPTVETSVVHEGMKTLFRNHSRSAGYVSENIQHICGCIKNTAALPQLLNLGIALRSSRETLEPLHEGNYGCVLYNRIVTLEKHIYTTAAEERPMEGLPPAKNDEVPEAIPIHQLSQAPMAVFGTSTQTFVPRPAEFFVQGTPGTHKWT